MQGLLTSLALPPLLLTLLALSGGLLAWRGWRPGGAIAAAAAGLQLLLATPFCADLLVTSLSADLRPGIVQPAGAAAPEAIVILGAEAMRDGRELDIGPLTLERLRVGAALARRTGLPLLVTAGELSPDEPPLGPLMARSLTRDFGVQAQWVEAQARDTRDNAVLSAAMLRLSGISSVWLVTHGWHMARAQQAFRRAGLATAAAPVHPIMPPEQFELDWMPRADHLAMSWFALREWAGRLVYAIRD
jgi:uncharacterized SAM-binding protein YcdF (DUF218 family)